MTVEGPLRHLKEHTEVIDADVRLIKARFSPGARLLDIGAGRGAFVTEAGRHGWDAVALDLQPQAAAVWSGAGINGVIGDGARAPFAASTFDVVRLKEVLEHVEQPLTMVREARRLLRKGGILLAHVPTPQSQFYPVANFWDDYTHVRPISRFGLRRLMEDGGLEVERIAGYMAGRNSLERALGKLLGRIFPHIYRVTARLPDESV